MHYPSARPTTERRSRRPRGDELAQPREEERDQYQIRVLPHADSQLAPNQFYIEGGSPTLQSYAAAWQWWYTHAEAQASNAQLTAAASCDSGAVYRSTD
jgi:hypothetical protein